MAKSQATFEIEMALYGERRKMAVYGCFEVSIGFYRHHPAYGDQRVDFITMDSQGIFRAYEIKVTKADFHSKCANSFVGHYNYYAMPLELYEQVKHEIPDHVGVWCNGVVKKPKRVEPSVPTDVLAMSMVRSLSRDADRYLQAIMDGDKPENRKLASERKKNQKTIHELRRSVQHLQESLSFYKGRPFVDLGEKADSIKLYRRLFSQAQKETRELRKEVSDLRERTTPMPARRDIAEEPTKDVNGGIFGKGVPIWFCPKCGMFNTPSHAFCWKCGQALSFDIPGKRAGAHAREETYEEGNV